MISPCRGLGLVAAALLAAQGVVLDGLLAGVILRVGLSSLTGVVRLATQAILVTNILCFECKIM